MGNCRSEILTDLTLNLIGARQHLIKASELINPLNCRFRSALDHSGYVVGGVPHQRQVVNDTVWRDAEFFYHAGHIQRRPAHCVNQGDIVVDQLRQIFITR